MELEQALKILNFSQQQMRLGNLPDYSQNVYKSVATLLKELERCKQENTMLENTKNNCPHLNTSGVSCGAKFCNLQDYINKDIIKTKIYNQVQVIDNLLEEMVDKSTGCINTSYLSKKEKEQVINKRNCLLVQKATLIDMKKDLLKEE